MDTTTPVTLPPLPSGWTWSDPDPRFPSVRAPNGVDISCSSIRQAVEIANTHGHLRAELATTTPPALSPWATPDLSLTIPSPGVLEGLLSYGAPLVTLVSSSWRSTCSDCGCVEEGRKSAHRPVLCVGADEYTTHVADGTDDPCGSPWSHDHVALRLDLEPGRACAAWWLAQQVKTLRGRGTGANFAYYCRGRGGNGSPGWMLTLLGVDKGSFSREVLFAPDFDGWQNYYILSVPALSGLDPDDPRTLPDGSRWVDAEALRRLVLSAADMEVR